MAAKGQGLKSSSNLQARIKKMMQSDEDVGKVAKASPVLIAKALDVFLHGIVEGASRIAEGRGARMLTASHIKAHIEGEELLDFLKDTVAAVPDLPAEGSQPPKAKRQRTKSEDSEAGPAKVRGRGGRGGRGGGRGGRGGRGKKGGDAEDAEGAAAAGGAGAEEGPNHDQQPAAAEGLAAAAAVPAAVQQQQQPGEQQAAAGEQQAVPQLQSEGGAAVEGGGAADVAPPVVSVPTFLAAAVAVPGADAEEEDYDS